MLPSVQIPSVCRLCLGTAASLILDDERRYYRCPDCALVFVDPAHLPTRDEEERRYRLHRNDAADAAYTTFLAQLADPVSARLATGATGLDFGCGPARALGGILSDRGYPTVSYDPTFFPDDSLLAATYDFVTCSEVVEHLHRPDVTFRTFQSLLRPGGVLGIMTRRYDGVDFSAWWYRRDPTHVAFYSRDTMMWIAHKMSWRLELPAPTVALFQA